MSVVRALCLQKILEVLEILVYKDQGAFINDWQSGIAEFDKLELNLININLGIKCLNQTLNCEK